MLIRNFGIKDLTLKVGRQLIVWGNHRLFGHFDWNNVGWSHDAISLRYVVNPSIAVEVYSFNASEGNFGLTPTSGGITPGTAGTASTDAWFTALRAPMNFMGVTFEPAVIFESGGTGTTVASPRPSNQTRWTVGGRVATKKAISNVMVDVTGEGYIQRGEIGPAGTTAVGRNVDIEALALHIDGGITLPVPMQPRIGLEFNYGSGDGDQNACAASVSGAACNGSSGSFDQLFPTNHIHFGYMDLMSWKNMATYSANLQLRPTKDSHLEVAGHIMRLANSEDNWYNATQGIYFTSKGTNTENDLGTEIDVVYTMFFTEGNHVGWQIGGGAFFGGDYLSKASATQGPTASSSPLDGNQTWGYTQLWINF
jgi:hypothetical protein